VGGKAARRLSGAVGSHIVNGMRIVRLPKMVEVPFVLPALTSPQLS